MAQPSVKHPFFDPFEEVVLGDSEYVATPGELYLPVSYSYKELRSGVSGTLFGDELNRLAERGEIDNVGARREAIRRDFGSAPPHRHDKKTHYICFTQAEPEFFGSIGWPFEMSLLDLRVEHINLTNISEKIPKDGRLERARPPRSLIDILRANGIADGDSSIKKAVRDRIMKGYPFDQAWRDRIMKYNPSDVSPLLEKLFEILLPRITNFKQALLRGEYVKLAAEIFCAGLPADPWSSAGFRHTEKRQAVRLRAVSNTNLTQGLYIGDTLTQAKVDEFVIRHGWQDSWRRTPKTRKFGKAGRDWTALSERFPEGHPEHQKYKNLREIGKTLSQLHDLKLIAGRDNRYRTPIWPFSTITGRMAPNGSAYPFTTPAWTKYTIMAEPGKALAYLDFSANDFGTAAGVSRCPMMQVDYRREPYLILPQLVGLVPAEATKHSHPKDRERYKAPILSLQYGGGALLMAQKLDITTREGQQLVDLHHERYVAYWEWSDRRLQRAFDDGELVTKDGWRCAVSSKTSIFTARNWLIQAIAGALFRYACLLMRKLGIRIIAVVHDAVLIEAPIDRIEEEVARATLCLQRASRRFLRGLTLEVDAKIVREGERLGDKRGTDIWNFFEGALRELDEGTIDAAE
jgi:hypothetical protein